ncbi:MAG: potassium transporter Kup, partial [Burkholderiales bacterium]|nr:potassium transporter Kup [Burkholderiales bacterium]
MHAAAKPVEASPPERARQALATLMLGAIGVVYGDIGTSPLYTLKEAFTGHHSVDVTQDNVLGVLSLVFWSLMSIVTLKYVTIIMRADNRGEGGIMALTALVLRATRDPRRRWVLMVLGLFGAALFYGDSMITPAISVLSAIEGLEIATPALQPYVVPIAIAVLIALFAVQRHGTARVGALFGPIMLLWFSTLGGLGIWNVLRYPEVLKAVNPLYAVQFFAFNGWHGYFALGSVVLAVTGAEALYADMGHFGRNPIRYTWLSFVLPALLLNYFGQGAVILHDPTAVRSPFYLQVPSWGLYPLLVLATAATVIASQAVISGAYSLTRQAIQLGYCPRMNVMQTSEHEIGQVYLPWINWVLLAAIIALVVGFGSSSNLAAAYGIAVTATMAIDSILAFVVMRFLWGWHIAFALPLAAAFLFIDIAYFTSNAIKIVEGGWFPVLVGVVVFILLATWHKGREILFDRTRPGAIPLEPFIQSIAIHPPTRVPGTAVFLTTSQEGVPHALLHNLNHNKVLHERILLLTVVTEEVPRVPDEDRVEIETKEAGFHRMKVRYGFKDEPDIPRALELADAKGIRFEPMETSYFLSRETLIPTVAPGMVMWREKLFVAMARNSASATAYFKLPTNRVVELGTQI